MRNKVYGARMHRPHAIVTALALFGASLLPGAASAQSATLQPFETQLYVNGTQYACVGDPSSWREANAAHDALVAQGYTESIWIASHPGFAPFSDQLYFLCRTPVGEPG